MNLDPSTTERKDEPTGPGAPTGDQASRTPWPLALGAGLAGLGLVMLLRIVGGSRLAIPVVLLLAILLLWADVSMRGRTSRDDRALRLPLALLAAGVVAVAIWMHWPGSTGGLGIFGVALVVMGSGWLVADVRHHGLLRAPACLLMLAGGAAAVAGAFLWRTNHGWSHALDASLLPVGLLVMLAGFGLLSGRLLDKLAGPGARPDRWHRLDRPGQVAVGIGAGLLLAAPLLLAGGRALWYATILVVVLFLLVGAIASDTSTDALVLVLAVALVWALMPRASHQTEPSLAAGGPTIVAFGDSFTSGEGAKHYYKGTNTPHVNACRRAPSAYPVVAGGSARQVVFVACSGAKAADIYRHAQYQGEPAGTGGLPQIAHYRAVLKDLKPQADVRLIVISIGGNDAGFGDVVQACIAPGNCAKAGPYFLRRLSQARAEIDRAFDALNAVRGRVPVLVVPYPIPLSETHCATSLLAPEEHRFVHGFAQQLDTVVEDAADRAHFYHLDAMENAFDGGLRLCDGPGRKIGVHTISLNPVDGAAELSVNPKNWIHNSFHPNAKGHRAMAGVLTQWMHDHPDPPPVAPATGTGTHAIASIDTIMGVDGYPACDVRLDDCGGSLGAWKLRQVGALALQSVPGLVAALLGACLVWFALLLARRRPRPDPDDEAETS